MIIIKLPQDKMPICKSLWLHDSREGMPGRELRGERFSFHWKGGEDHSKLLLIESRSMKGKSIEHPQITTLDDI